MAAALTRTLLSAPCGASAGASVSRASRSGVRALRSGAWPTGCSSQLRSCDVSCIGPAARGGLRRLPWRGCRCEWRHRASTALPAARACASGPGPPRDGGAATWGRGGGGGGGAHTPQVAAAAAAAAQAPPAASSEEVILLDVRGALPQLLALTEQLLASQGSCAAG